MATAIASNAGKIHMYSGAIVNPFYLQPEDICLTDIVYGLAGIRRYQGQSRLTVAQHSCHVADELQKAYGDPRLTLAGLMHDASEAYLGDIPSPMKCLPEFEFYRVAEDRAMQIIARRFGFLYPLAPEVHEVDVRMRFTEQRDIYGRKARPDDSHRAFALKIVPWSDAAAELQFRTRYYRLTRELR